jgi:uncharacterized protein (DUF427 family)
MKAIWKGEVIAESDQIIEHEGNYYFPKESLRRDYFKKSLTKSSCPWKGKAKYYSLKVGKALNKDAAWTYTDPNLGARIIKDHVAFWKGVKIEK